MNISINRKLKRYLIIIALVAIWSFIYTFMIAVLFSNDISSINYYIDSGISATLIGCLCLFIVSRIDGFINKFINKSTQYLFTINFVLSAFINIIFFGVLSWLLNLLVRGEASVGFSFFKEQIVIVNYIIILILAYHTIVYFTRNLRIQNSKLKADNVEMKNTLNHYLFRIPSTSNKKTSLIPIDQIEFIRIEDGVVFAHTLDKKKNPLSFNTLNTIESKLNPSGFFRINRSEIVNINFIDSYEPYFKDRIAIKLNKSGSILYTSNTKSAPFREWLMGN